MSDERALTGRALAAGCLIGAVLSVQNLYLGLKTGSWDSGTITASVIGFAIFAWRGKTRYSARENNITQTTSSAIAAMPAAAGLLGAIPALALMSRRPSAFTLAALALALGTLGVVFAVILRGRLIVDEKLPFPTGTAVADVIRAMHASGREASTRARALFASAGLNGIIVWFRDGFPAVLPQGWFWPITLRGTPAQALTLGFSWSPMMFCVGPLVGPQIAMSMGLGALIAWVGLAPTLVRTGLVEHADYPSLIGWLAWPGVGLLVAASLIGLLEQSGALLRTVTDFKRLGRQSSDGRASAKPLALLAVPAVALLVFAATRAFGMPWYLTLLALLISLPVASVCTRAAGETDTVPLGSMGQLTQALYAVVAPGRALVNIGAAGVVAGVPAQTAQTMESFKTGHLLDASWREQLTAALIGVIVGAAIAIPVYGVLTSAHAIGSPALPAPPAVLWKSVAEVMTEGKRALPPRAALAAVCGLSLGAALTLLARRKRRMWLPSPVAMGMGMLMPAQYAFTLLAGSLTFVLIRRRWPGPAEHYGESIAAGAIAGESLVGLGAALMAAAGWI